MTSSALYRRWRPQTFGDLLGQDHVVRTLQAAIREEKVSHAYLFSGSRGTGKTSTARILAKALNCERGPAEEPCNECPTCIGITEGSSLDVIEIDAASHGGVDDVRDLRDSAVLSPASARRKIYIIDEAHMVSTQGWNAFLKTVEEPPDHVVFVFATTEPQKVLPTILSRCQRFEFRRISSNQLADHLRRICEAEKITAEDSALQMIARAAEGGARDALSTLDQLASAGPVTVADATRLLGVTNIEALFQAADALVDQRSGEVVDLIAQLVDEGHDLRVFARGLLEHLRGLLLSAQLEKPEQVLDVGDETLQRYKEQATRTHPSVLYHAMRAVTDALADMRQLTPPRLALEMALLRVTMPQLEETATAAVSRIARLERLVEVGGAPVAEQKAPEQATPPKAVAQKPEPAAKTTPEAGPAKGATSAAKAPKKAAKAEPEAPAPVPSAVSADLDLDMVRKAWPTVLDAVKRSSRVLHSKLAAAHLVDVSDGVLHLEHPQAFLAENLSSGKSAEHVGAAIQEVLGARVRLKVTHRAGASEEELDTSNFDRETVAADAFDPIDVFKQGFGPDLEVEE
jgi:DNA polymerase III subunit gamma/tau